MDTSVLYVLTKSENVSLNFEEEIIINDRLCNEGPLVSIILPCYNHEKFVAEAIESVVNQSYKNIEIIVMDDASTDNTASVMKRYSSYFAKEIYLKKNIGGDTTNLLQYVNGKYVALMHSDDVWEKDKIAIQVEYLENHLDVDVCLSWCKYTDEYSNELDDNTFIQKNRSNFEWMKFFWTRGNALCNPSTLMRREISKEIQKYGLSCRQLPDFFKWVCLIQKHSIYIVPKVLVKMKRYQKNSIENVSASTRTNSIRHMVEEGSIWIWILRDMDMEFFKKAFRTLMINPNIDKEDELKCEKYFLLLNHYNIFVQNSAYTYINEVYNEIEYSLKEKYNYSRINISEDMLNKGLGKVLL